MFDQLKQSATIDNNKFLGRIDLVVSENIVIEMKVIGNDDETKQKPLDKW